MPLVQCLLLIRNVYPASSGKRALSCHCIKLPALSERPSLPRRMRRKKHGGEVFFPKKLTKLMTSIN